LGVRYSKERDREDIMLRMTVTSNSGSAFFLPPITIPRPCGSPCNTRGPSFQLTESHLLVNLIGNLKEGHRAEVIVVNPDVILPGKEDAQSADVLPRSESRPEWTCPKSCQTFRYEPP